LVDMLIVAGMLVPLMAWRGVEPDLRPWYGMLAAVSGVLFHMSGILCDLYHSWRGASLRQECWNAAQAWVLTVCALLLLGYVAKVATAYSRQILLTWILAVPATLAAWRLLLRRGIGVLRRTGKNWRTAAIVGAGSMAERAAREICSRQDMGLRFLGLYDDDLPVGEAPFEGLDVKICGTVVELTEKARNGEVNCVYVAHPLSDGERIGRVLMALEDTTASVFVIPTLSELDLAKATWSSLGALPVVSVYDTPFYGVDGMVKTLEDAVLGTAILAVAAVPMLVIALAVRLTSQGPVIFKQRRYGIDGKEIVVWKFRTMRVTEDGDHIVQAAAGDERVTRLGHFLRRTSLDELPQFINVLQWRMSIVGPRPHAVAHNEMYRKLIRGYMLRHKVKPGITGWAQVNGWRGETDSIEKMEKRIEYDLEYVREWSLMLDLKIMVMTVLECLNGRNAC